MKKEILTEIFDSSITPAAKKIIHQMRRSKPNTMFNIGSTLWFINKPDKLSEKPHDMSFSLFRML